VSAALPSLHRSGAAERHLTSVPKIHGKRRRRSQVPASVIAEQSFVLAVTKKSAAGLCRAYKVTAYR
jgi:hypothetical protein